MTLNDQDSARGSGDGGGVRLARPGRKRDAAAKDAPARQPDPLRRVVSSTGPERAPDFFCVGGDPSSMTRLWHLLTSHPDVAVPIAPNAKHSSKAGSDVRRSDLAALAGLLSEPAAIDAGTAQQIATELRLAVGTDRAYLRIFGGLSHRAVGEVSAHPSLLTTAGVRRLQRLAPAAKVILLLDDPVERVIATAAAAAAAAETDAGEDTGEDAEADRTGKSQSGTGQSGPGQDGPRTVADRARRLAASKQTLSQAIEHHRVAFGEQLYVAFCADITSRPASLLESMGGILGIDWTSAPDAAGVPGTAADAVTAEVTPEVRRELYVALAGEYGALAELYPEAVARWRSRQEGLIGG